MFCLLGYIQIYLKLRKHCNFGTKNSQRAWHVTPAQEVSSKHSENLFVRIFQIYPSRKLSPECLEYFAYPSKFSVKRPVQLRTKQVIVGLERNNQESRRTDASFNNWLQLHYPLREVSVCLYWIHLALGKLHLALAPLPARTLTIFFRF